MKTTVFILLAVLLSACGYDGIGLQGKWEMTSWSVPDPPASGDVIAGTVIWTFDEGSRRIWIVSKDFPYSDEFETREYQIISVDTIHQGNKQIIVAESNLGKIYLSNDTLEISQAEVDGISYRFVKMPLKK